MFVPDSLSNNMSASGGESFVDRKITVRVLEAKNLNSDRARKLTFVILWLTACDRSM